jgi:electron transport complex protein RnfB
MEAVTEQSGWAAWSPEQAEHARQRYAVHRLRLTTHTEQNAQRLMNEARDKLGDIAGHSRITDPQELERKKAVVAAALERAQAKRARPAG